MTTPRFACLAAFAAWMSAAAADYIVLDTGRRIEGTVVVETPEWIEVRGRHVLHRLARRVVVRVEPARLSWEEYAERVARVGDDVASRVALADWCESRGLLVERDAQLEAVIRVDSEHAGARRRLGYRRDGGRWVPDGPAWVREWREADARWWRPSAPSGAERVARRRAAGAAWLAGDGATERLDAALHAATGAAGEVRKDALAELAALRAPLEAIELRVAELSSAAPVPAGSSDFEFAYEGGRTRCFVALPPECGAGGVRHPLLLTQHCGSEDAAARRDRFAARAAPRGWIVAAPHSAPNFDQGWGSTEPERSVALRALDELIRRYPVDPDRVVINGGSMGGNGAWEIAMLYRDRFAGLAPWISGPRVRNLPLAGNLRGLPIHARVGEQEHPLMVEANREAIALLGPPAALEVEPAWAHVERPEVWDAALFDWAESLRRDAFPTHLVHHFVRLNEGRHHWLAAERLSGAPLDPTGGRIPVNPRADDAAQRAEYVRKGRTGCARLAARIDGQTVEIETKHVARLTVWLADPLIDLDRAVVVRWNGREVFRGRVERSVEVLLDEIARTRDSGRVYTARLSLPRLGRSSKTCWSIE